MIFAFKNKDMDEHEFVRQNMERIRNDISRCCGYRIKPNTTEMCGKRNDCKRFIAVVPLKTQSMIEPRFVNYLSRNGRILWSVDCEDFLTTNKNKN